MVKKLIKKYCKSIVCIVLASVCLYGMLAMKTLAASDTLRISGTVYFLHSSSKDIHKVSLLLKNGDTIVEKKEVEFSGEKGDFTFDNVGNGGIGNATYQLIQTYDIPEENVTYDSKAYTIHVVSVYEGGSIVHYQVVNEVGNDEEKADRIYFENAVTVSEKATPSTPSIDPSGENDRLETSASSLPSAIRRIVSQFIETNTDTSFAQTATPSVTQLPLYENADTLPDASPAAKHWSLFTVIFALFSLLATTVSFRKKNVISMLRRLLTCIATIVSVAVMILFEDFRSSMVLADKMTIVTAVLLILSIVSVFVRKNDFEQ